VKAVAEETWLTFDQAVQLVCEHYGANIGYAKKLVKDAGASREVQHEPLVESIYLTRDDGLFGFDPVPEIELPIARRLSKCDLVDWLDRQYHKPLELPPTRQEWKKPGKRAHTSREWADKAIAACFPNDVPAGIRPSAIYAEVTTWLAPRLRGDTAPGKSTILRAAGRKK
jgi:hypothetical protein